LLGYSDEENLPNGIFQNNELPLTGDNEKVKNLFFKFTKRKLKI